jgi:hypothetical protein
LTRRQNNGFCGQAARPAAAARRPLSEKLKKKFLNFAI